MRAISTRSWLAFVRLRTVKVVALMTSLQRSPSIARNADRIPATYSLLTAAIPGARTNSPTLACSPRFNRAT